MITFSDDEILDRVTAFSKKFENDSNNILMFDTFIQKVLNRKYNEAIDRGKLSFPKVCKIAPSNAEMLKALKDGNDFMSSVQPERIINIQKPITYNYTPIWWDSSADGVDLNFGFENKDSRKPSRISLNDSTIHGFLGGITGMGKSVTLNTLIFSMAFQYAPWEIEITLLDAKAADLKAFGRMHLPHISAVAATKDTDYIISVLEEKIDEMSNTQDIIGRAGYNKIGDFVKGTGLIIPRRIIIIDEVQSLYKNAGKNAAKIDKMFDAFSRLGRSAGYHLFCASQEIGDTLSQNTMNQFAIRCCLGATEAVSEKILGNNDAKNIRTKGRMLVTTDPNSKDISKNKEFKVPYQPNDGENNQFEIQGTALIHLGRKVNFSRDLSFYDANKKMYESQFLKYISQFNNDVNKIYLGEPSFVMRDVDKVVRMEFDSMDAENIFIFGKELRNLTRYGRMIKYNLDRAGSNSVVLSANQDLAKEIGITDQIYIPVSIASDGNIVATFNTIIARKLILDVDSRTDEYSSHPEIDKVLINKWGEDDPMFNSLNRSRAYIIDGLLRTAEYESLVPSHLKNKDKDDYIDNLIITYLEMYRNYGCYNSIVTVSDLPITYIWIVGIDRIRGWGRDNNNSMSNRLKNIMYDSCNVNVRFIILSNSIEDLSEILKPIKYVITDKQEDRVINRLGAADYFPSIVPDELGVLINKSESKAFKFKKMYFDDEN